MSHNLRKIEGRGPNPLLRLWLHRNYVWIWRRGDLGVLDCKAVCLTSKWLASAFQTRLTSRLGRKTSNSKWSVEAREGERGQTGSTGASKVVNCAVCKERQVVCALLNLRNICFQGWVHMLSLQKEMFHKQLHSLYFSWNTTCRLEICQKIYTTEDFRVKNLHRKRVIFDIC